MTTSITIKNNGPKDVWVTTMTGSEEEYVPVQTLKAEEETTLVAYQHRSFLITERP